MAGPKTFPHAHSLHQHTGSDSFQVAHADLSGVSSDQHHAQAHALIGADHTGSDEAILSRHLAPTIIQETSTGNVTTSGTTELDITGCTSTFTPAIASYALVFATFTFLSPTVDNDLFQGLLDVDGVNAGGAPQFRAAEIDHRESVSFTWLVALSAAEHTLKLQAVRVGGTGTVTVQNTHTRMTIWLFGDANVTAS